MTRDETKQILMMMFATYPSLKVDNKQVMLDTWATILADDDAQLIRNALVAFIKTDKTGFAPTIGQLHTLIAETALKGNSEGEIKAYLSRASKNALYGFQKEFEKMPEQLQKAVGSPEVIRTWGTQTPEQLEYTFNRICNSYQQIVNRDRLTLASGQLTVNNHFLLGEKHEKIYI